MANEVMVGSYTLPSLGKVYKQDVNPEVQLRSMTTAEEMKRLNPSDRPYKVMADIIDDCLVTKPGISSYDMCMGDYGFLLHRLRIVTYGSIYPISSVCPYCGETNYDKLDLNQLEVLTYTDDILKYLELDLPRTGHHITLRMQTPRMIDETSIRAKEWKKKSKNSSGDPAFLFTLESVIDTVDGEKVDTVTLSEFIRNLPMMDTNELIQCEEKLNELIGVSPKLTVECDICGLEYESTFRTTSEFFRPTIYK